MVLFYEGRWYMFSNFSAFAIIWRGEDWRTTEHAYQAAKFREEYMWKQVHETRSAHDAKKVAQYNGDFVRKDWQEIKLSVMEEILRAKLEQHQIVREALLETGNLGKWGYVQ